MKLPNCIDANGEEWDFGDVFIYKDLLGNRKLASVERFTIQRDGRWYLDTMDLPYLVAADCVEHYHGPFPTEDELEHYGTLQNWWDNKGEKSDETF